MEDEAGGGEGVVLISFIALRAGSVIAWSRAAYLQSLVTRVASNIAGEFEVARNPPCIDRTQQA